MYEVQHGGKGDTKIWFFGICNIWMVPNWFNSLVCSSSQTALCPQTLFAQIFFGIFSNILFRIMAILIFRIRCLAENFFWIQSILNFHHFLRIVFPPLNVHSFEGLSIIIGQTWTLKANHCRVQLYTRHGFFRLLERFVFRRYSYSRESQLQNSFRKR